MSELVSITPELGSAGVTEWQTHTDSEDGSLSLTVNFGRDEIKKPVSSPKGSVLFLLLG